MYDYDYRVMKEQFGFSNELQRYLQDTEKTIPKGSFVIIKRGDKHYWYFNKSKGSNRLIYLCPVDKKGEETNSFIYSTKILKEKTREGVGTYTKKGTSLIKIIDDYILKLRSEGSDNKRGVERTKKTIQDIISHIRKFREYVGLNPISVKDLQRESFREYANDYISWLVDIGLKPSTIRVTLVHFRQFLDELVEPRSGKKVIPYHPITSTFIKNQYSVSVRDKVHPDFYTEEKYINLLKICSKEMRDTWREYIKTGIVQKEKVIFFTSFLQLVYGFRIGELTTTYKSKTIKEDTHTTKSGFSFLEKTDENGYIFNIYWKRKWGSVNVDFDVYSWVKPPDYIPYKETYLEIHHLKPTYQTNIIDTIVFMFSDEILLIPTYVDTLRKYFRKELIKENGLEDYGIKSPHDLRDMMINYELHTKKTSFVDLSQMTRNKIQTIENYYLHTIKELSISQSRKLNTKNRLKEINSVLQGE